MTITMTLPQVTEGTYMETAWYEPQTMERVRTRNIRPMKAVEYLKTGSMVSSRDSGSFFVSLNQVSKRSSSRNTIKLTSVITILRRNC